jgi:hypothetical protein
MAGLGRGRIESYGVIVWVQICLSFTYVSPHGDSSSHTMDALFSKIADDYDPQAFVNEALEHLRLEDLREW